MNFKDDSQSQSMRPKRKFVLQIQQRLTECQDNENEVKKQDDEMKSRQIKTKMYRKYSNNH